MVGGVRGLLAAGHIPDCIDAAIAGSEPFVDRDSVLVKLDAGSLEAEADHIGPSAASDQKMAPLDRLLPARRAPARGARLGEEHLELGLPLCALVDDLVGDLGDRPGVDRDALARELVE